MKTYYCYRLPTFELSVHLQGEKNSNAYQKQTNPKNKTEEKQQTKNPTQTTMVKNNKITPGITKQVCSHHKSYRY